MIDDIVWNHWIDQDKHSIHGEYVSDDLYQDGDSDFPFGAYITYENGGPEFEIEEPYLASWHKDRAIKLLEEEGYDALLEEF